MASGFFAILDDISALMDDVAAMSNIPSTRRVAGSLAFVTNDSLFRMWDGSAWSATNLRAAIGLGAANDVTFNKINFVC